MKLLFVAFIVVVPVCTLLLLVMLNTVAQRIVEAIHALSFGALPVANISVTGRGAPTAADVMAAKERANFKDKKELPQGCPENNGGECTEDCGPGMPVCKKRARKLQGSGK